MTPALFITVLLGSMLAADLGTYPAYTIHMTERMTTGPGSTRKVPLKREITATQIVAQKSDGSHADHLYMLGLPDPTTGQRLPGDEIMIFDVLKRRTIYAFKFLNAKSTYPQTAQRLQQTAQANNGKTGESDCLLTKTGSPAWSQSMLIERRETILGFDAVVLVRTFEKPASARYWLVPSLGCVLVKSVYNYHDKSGQLVSISEKEPDRILIGPRTYWRRRHG